MSGSEPPLPRVPAEERDYFRRIEERFGVLRGGPMLLSPRDWKLITDWRAAGIPLAVVLESLEEVFASRARRGDPANRVHSLSYVTPEVRRRWELHRELTSLRSGGGEAARFREEIRRHLGRLSRRLREAAERARSDHREPLARMLVVSAAEVARLRKEAAGESWDRDSAEAALDALDREVMLAARTALGVTERREMDADAGRSLDARQEAMRPEILSETRKALEDRFLRRRFLIPRIAILGLG